MECAVRGGNTDLLADPDIEIVLNLTIPAAHASVSTTALEAGKHVWSEKPIAVDRESAQALVDLAASVAYFSDRSRYSAGPRLADRDACHPLRRDRYAADRGDELPMAGPRLVSSQSGVLVPPRRRSGLRHGAYFSLRSSTCWVQSRRSRLPAVLE